MTNKEVAEKLGVSPATVKTLANRAMQKVRVRMVILDMIEKGFSDDEISDKIAAMDSANAIKYLCEEYPEVYSLLDKPCYTTSGDICQAARLNGHGRIRI